MDNSAGGSLRRQVPGAILGRLRLTISRSAEGGFPACIVVGVQAGLLLLLLVGCTVADWRAGGQQAHDQQDMVAAHPEWAPGIRGAVVSGVISAGMSTDMVRAAWGRPTRVSSSRSELEQRDVWHYTGRLRNADVIGSQTARAQPLGEWTVAFVNGWVVGWTD
jgi:hypothetical protein